ncbi:phosphoribosyltransferase [Candidatus Babeliales bacterium]|nr:phosphoribosyltransferase [Candidatus Babeliales bacterium]
MLFKNRKDAGIKLVRKLNNYKNNKDVLVIGLPRGGVIVAYEVAKNLNAKLDIIVVRKIGAPFRPELAIGAITQDGELILDNELFQSLGVKKEYLDQQVEIEKKEAQRRLNLYRKNRSPLQLKDKIIILVDDGIATGSSILVAIKSIKSKQPQKIIVAVPVAPPDIFKKIEKEIDEFICLEIPSCFDAVGSFYGTFPQTEDEEVIEVLSGEI